MLQNNPPNSSRFIFPRWVNYLLPVIVIGAVGGAFYLPVAFAFGASPQTMAVGYAPEQPVPYSHAVHAGKLGLDCRYCHTTVEKTAFAALPATQTCMNCHTRIKTKIANPDKTPGAPDTIPNPRLAPVFNSWSTGQPVQWVRVHELAGYVYFNHSAHVNHGVGCIECHGRIDHMDVVRQEKPLAMGWCLECHRDPGSHLRPREVAVTNMEWNRDGMSKDQVKRLPDEYKSYFDVQDGDSVKMSDAKSNELSAKLLKDYGVRDVAYMQSCYTCHR